MFLVAELLTMGFHHWQDPPDQDPPVLDDEEALGAVGLNMLAMVGLSHFLST